MGDIKSSIAKNIIALRTANGMTQLQLAEKLNYSDKAVSKWEHADSLPDITVLVEISNLFNVSLDYLVREIHTEKEVTADIRKNNTYTHSIITGLSLLLVCLISVFTYVLISLIKKAPTYRWLVFVYTIPVLAIVWLVFNSIWFNRHRNYFIISVLLWSVLASVQLSFVPFGIDIRLIYLLGLPIQLIVFLCSILKKKPKIMLARELSQK